MTWDRVISNLVGNGFISTPVDNKHILDCYTKSNDVKVDMVKRYVINGVEYVSIQSGYYGYNPWIFREEYILDEFLTKYFIDRRLIKNTFKKFRYKWMKLS